MISEKTARKAKELRRAGWERQDIADRLGISITTVRQLTEDIPVARTITQFVPLGGGELRKDGLKYSRNLFRAVAAWHTKKIGWCIKLAGVSDDWLKYIKRRAEECLRGTEIEEPLVYRIKSEDPYIEIFFFEY